MTIPNTPLGRTRRLRPLPDGDPGRITPVTRVIWADQRDMPTDRDAMACIAEDGSTVIVVREGLSASARRAEVRRLRHAVRGLGAGRLAATGIIVIDGLRRFGWHYPWLRALAYAQEYTLPVAAAGTVAVAGVVTGGAIIAAHHGPDGPAVGSPAWHRQHPVHVTLPPKPLSYLGAFETDNQANSYAGMNTFAATCGRQPNVALYYSGWFEQFQFPFANEAAAHGAIPLVQINPEIDPGNTPISLAAIAAGQYDNYLISYADQVATYHKAVIIGVGHEFNGNWYPWGEGHQSPADFVAAWRHIVTIFRRQGAFNVTWLWTPNVIHKAEQDLSQWWPGSSYVTWIGVDGYYRNPDDTWSNVFAPTIAEVRQFTTAPILIAETAIGPAGTEPWQLNDMYASIRQNSYLGLVWFDEDKPGLPYRLEDNPQSVNTQQIIAVFRQETLSWRLQHQKEAKPGA